MVDAIKSDRLVESDENFQFLIVEAHVVVEQGYTDEK